MFTRWHSNGRDSTNVPAYVLVVCFGDMSSNHIRYHDPLRRMVIATFYHVQALRGTTGTTFTLNFNLNIPKLPRFDVERVDEVEFTPYKTYKAAISSVSPVSEYTLLRSERIEEFWDLENLPFQVNQNFRLICFSPALVVYPSSSNSH